MSNFEVGLIIVLVIGVIASNLAVLKYTAKFKMPQFGKPKTHLKADNDDVDPESKPKAEDSSDKEDTKNREYHD